MGGALIVLFVIVSGVVVAYVREGAEDTTFSAETCSSGNATACAGDPDDVDFLDQVQDASPADLGEDTPGIITVLWTVTIVFLLAAGLLLIALAFVPLTSE